MINLKHIKLLLLLGMAPFAASADNSVGTPVAAVDVDRNGAATYNLSVEIPNGGGFQPQIGLAYNSQFAGYGNAGYGFNITGISVITSGSRNLYYDGKVKGTDYLANSSFYLDGKRLVLESGTEGCDGAKYSVEGDPYTTVTVHGSFSTSSVSTWFEVLTPDGTTYKYGNTSISANSRLSFTQDGKARCAAWYISQAIDKYKNTIKYNYMIVNKMVLPTSITYGENTAKSRGISCSVKFDYSDIIYNSTTDNVRNFYIGSVKGNISKKLSTITSSITNSGNTYTYRKYTLGYGDYIDGSSKKYTRLTSITESNASGETYAPVKIDWKGLEGFSLSNRSISINTKRSDEDEKTKNFFTVDINNDGISDIVRYTEYDGNKSCFDISISDIDSNGKITYTLFQYNIGIFTRNKEGEVTSGVNGFLVGDFNGDGYTDIMTKYIYNTNNQWYQQFTYLKGGISPSTAKASYGKAAYKSYNYKPMSITMDVDGDGKTDIISLSKVKKNGYYDADIIYNSSTSGQCSCTTLSLQLPEDPKRMFSIDLNNDGLSDLIVLGEKSYKVFFNNGFNGSATGLFTNANSKSLDSSKNTYCLRDYQRVNPGDFNGDGLTDFLCSKKDEGKLYLEFNNGDGTFSHKETPDFGLYKQDDCEDDDDDFSINVMDFDHDGIDDVMIAKSMFAWHHGSIFESSYYRYSNGEGTTYMKWLKGTGSNLEVVRTYSKKNREKDASSRYIFVGDFDGDGSAELANYGAPLNSSSTAFSEHTIHLYRMGGNAAALGKVSCITNSLGVRNEFTYSSATDPKVCENGTTHKYPVNSRAIPLPVVSQLSTSANGISTNTTQFKYGDMIIHSLGRGTLGFRSFTKKSLNTGVTEKNTIKSWSINNLAPSVITDTITLSNGSISTTQKLYNCKRFATSFDGTEKFYKYFAYPAYTVEKDFDGNSTTTTYGHDTDKGVMTSIKVSNDGDNMYKQETYTYSSSKIANTWLPIQKKITQKHIDDNKTYNVTAKYTYDSYGNLLTKVTTPNSTSSFALTTTCTYDNFGNKKSEITTGSNVKALKKLYNYDSSGRFVTSIKTSPASKYIVYKYNVYGDMSEEIDSTVSTNVLVTSYLYNKWNELTKKTYPDKTYVTYTKAWDSSKNSGCYSITEAPNNGPKVKTIYDMLGREVFSTSKGLGKIDISKETAYATNGKVCRIATTTGQHTKVENFGYDNRTRMVAHVVQQVANTPNQYTTVYSYGNRKTSKTLDGRSVTTTYDAWGNAKTVTDNGGTINYTYFSNGKPKAIGGIKIEYDAAGNKTSLTDPDAGTKKYTYAADGTILTETDARGVVTTYTYDSLGRLTRTKIGSDIIRNYYKNGGYGHLQLEEQSMNGYVTKYEYDQYGRVTTEKRTTDKATLTNTYSYNTKGQLSQRTFTGGLTVKYYYDINGFDSLVVANNKVVHRVVANTGSSNSLSTTYSFLDKMNITTTKTFTSSNCNTNIRIKNGSSVIDNYDDSRQLTTGNMLSRQKNTDMPESFQYDNCDRLTKVTHPDGTGLEMSYGKDGIITRKSDMGNYNYDNKEHAHAVSSVTDCVSSKIYDYYRVSTEFNDFGKVSYIGDDHSCMTYYYGPDLQRWRSSYSNASGKTWEALYFGDYERITDNGRIREFYYICDNVIIVRDNLGAFKPCLVLTDGLGSILTVRDENATKVFDATYDVWGKQTVKVNSIGLMRGYTGHEHVYGYEFINMNGRIYDPILAQFLSPDKYVQDPTNSQNFNRYAYCINNPLKYTDPSGELFGFIGGLIRGICKVFTNGDLLAPFKESVNGLKLDFKVAGGLFVGDFKQIVSRNTWESLQTAVGLLYSEYNFLVHDVEDVEYYDGATYVINKNNDKRNGCTLGSFIYINDTHELPYDEHGKFAPYMEELYMHEYGHYLQSQEYGFGYLFSVGIPSGWDLWWFGDGDKYTNIRGIDYKNHSLKWYELDASKRGHDHFDGLYESWDYWFNPIEDPR